MTSPDRIDAIYLGLQSADLDVLSVRQVATLHRQIRQAIADAKRRASSRVGRPITSTHPRARYWREYKRRKAQRANA
jgi:hypothetical protein